MATIQLLLLQTLAIITTKIGKAGRTLLITNFKKFKAYLKLNNCFLCFAINRLLYLLVGLLFWHSAVTIIRL